MSRKKTTIDSLDDIRQLLPTILATVNADSALAVRAAANPLLALEEMGYQVAEEIRPTLERRIRFPKATFDRMETLAGHIYRIAGRRFPLNSPDALARVLFVDLKLRLPGGKRPTGKPSASAPRADSAAGASALPDISLPPRLKWGPEWEDPLIALKGAHPILEPLLEYRSLEAGEPRFASPELYARLRSGDITLPSLRFRVGPSDASTSK